MIYLVTDFGINGPYLGQILSVFAQKAPRIPIINLISDAPIYDPVHTAYLLAAYTQELDNGDIVLGVIDPGVGGDRAGVVLNADGVWYIGPDNGLFEVASSRANNGRWWVLPDPAASASVSFHGRDWFAPFAADLASGLWQPASAGSLAPPSGGHDMAPECAEIIYVDHYGNAMTGLLGTDLPRTATLVVDNHHFIPWARNFAAVSTGSPFWYVNANGLVELAANRARVCDVLDIEIGTPVRFLV